MKEAKIKCDNDIPELVQSQFYQTSTSTAVADTCVRRKPNKLFAKKFKIREA